MKKLEHKDLLDAGVHFGHLTRKWNPAMAPYIFMEKNVLLCKNSCDGDVKRLEDKNYAIYLTRILRYLCNRF